MTGPDARFAQQGYTFRVRSAQQGFTFRVRSAEHGFTSRVRSAEHGFTLIELLVALSIFAILSVAGVMLMRGSVSVQDAVGTHLDTEARIVRARAVLRQDFEQAVPRITRTDSGALAPAFFTRPVPDDQPIILLVRSGWANINNSARPSLQKVEYLFRNGRLERRTYPMLDGAQPQDPMILLDGIEQLRITYRTDQGNWVDSWQQPEAAALPRAAKIELKMQGGQPQTWLFLVAPGEGRPDAEMPEQPGA